MKNNSYPEQGLKQKVKYGAKVALIFLSAFIAMTVFEVRNFQQSNQQISQDMVSLSNAHSNINPTNLDQFKGRTLILYSSTCKACHEVIPKYYGVDRLVDSLTFHKAPIYLDINHGNNRDIFNDLNITSTPKRAKINNVQYDKTTQQITNIEQSQSDVSPTRTAGMLIFINVFWSALIALIYLLLWDGARYWIRKSHSNNLKQ